jgi:hypothetical protein
MFWQSARERHADPRGKAVDKVGAKWVERRSRHRDGLVSRADFKVSNRPVARRTRAFVAPSHSFAECEMTVRVPNG